jgi:hypothetical protein
MPHVPKRPPALEHLSDEAASIVLARHFGDFVKASRDLGVKRTDLRRLTWHNPRILKASHERMELFHIGVKSKIIAALYSRSAKRRRWGFDAMFDSYEFRDHPFASARWAQREQVKATEAGRLVLEREAAAELARERDGDRRRETGEIVVDIEPSVTPAAQAGSLWPAGIRRPSRGMRWR